jgi:hypothetical protein
LELTGPIHVDLLGNIWLLRAFWPHEAQKKRCAPSGFASFRAGNITGMFCELSIIIATMERQSNGSQKTGEFPSGRFQRAMRRILSVPKEEIAKREAACRKQRQAKKASGRATLGAFIIVSLCCLPIQPIRANPEERAQLLKTAILRKLVADGWQLVQESPSLLVVERPMTGWGGPVVQALTTGSYGTKPVIRWSITLIAESEHYTQYSASAVVNSQNAFGQMTSIPINNKKNLDYINRLIKAASDGVPAKYKFKDK